MMSASGIMLLGYLMYKHWIKLWNYIASLLNILYLIIQTTFLNFQFKSMDEHRIIKMNLVKMHANVGTSAGIMILSYLQCRHWLEKKNSIVCLFIYSNDKIMVQEWKALIIYYLKILHSTKSKNDLIIGFTTSKQLETTLFQ